MSGRSDNSLHLVCSTALLLLATAASASQPAFPGTTRQSAGQPRDERIAEARGGGADWPMWRCDAARSGSSAGKPDFPLHLQWTQRMPALTPAWPNDKRVRFDGCYQPVVLGGMLFVGSSLDDCLLALDAATGAEVWRYYANGPIRFAPACAKDKVYFVSDDGYLYCLNAATGTLVWRFRGGPSDRKAVGNERLISAWPARGGPVLVDGKVYFAAGIWPFMGVFVHALDAETGKPLWTNSESSYFYGVVDHNYCDYTGIAPQGYLAVAGDRLIVPCGRSLPACFDRRTGKLLYYGQGYELCWTRNKNWNSLSWQGGNWQAIAAGKYLVNVTSTDGQCYGALMEMDTGGLVYPIGLTTFPANFALDGDIVYGSPAHGTSLDAVDLKSVTSVPQVKDPASLPVWNLPPLWRQRIEAVCVIKSGNHLLTATKGFVRATAIPADGAAPAVVWEARLDGAPAGLIAAHDRMYVVMRTGELLCFGPKETQARQYTAETKQLPETVDQWTAKTRELVAAAEGEGFALVLGANSGRLAEELVKQSKLQVVVAEADDKKANDLRRRMASAGLYAARIAVVKENPLDFEAPPYFARMIASETMESCGLSEANRAKKIAASIRPYGGIWAVPSTAHNRPEILRWLADLNLRGTSVENTGAFSILRRVGALAGAADWTHEYANAGRTCSSADELVKCPLGVLWFGGPSETLFSRPFMECRYYPVPQVISGMLLGQGQNKLHAVDIYTGKLLWQTPLPAPKEAFQVFRTRFPGYTFVAQSDTIYAACGEKCLRLDPRSGEVQGQWTLPESRGRSGEEPVWADILVEKDLLIALAATPRRFWEGSYKAASAHLSTAESIRLAEWIASLRSLKKVEIKQGESPTAAFDRTAKEILESDDLSARFSPALRDEMEKANALKLNTSERIVTMDRQSGRVRWTFDAVYGFLNVQNRLGNPRWTGVVAGGGKVFALDAPPDETVKFLQRRGQIPEVSPRLLALDAPTGRLLWESGRNVAKKVWLAYSEKHDVLLAGGGGQTHAVRGADGQDLWTVQADGWSRPPIVLEDSLVVMNLLGDLSGKTILTDYNSMYRNWSFYNLETGRKEREFEAPGAYCGYGVAARNLIALRSTSAACYDLTQSRLANLAGFRTGCVSNLIPAGGLLNAPFFADHCACNYPIFTSLGLVHMPELADWMKVPSENARLSKRNHKQ